MEKELAEYRSLYATLMELYERYLKRKRELGRILEETAALRRDALLVLAKANRLTRYMTSRQRQASGLSFHPDEIKARIGRCGPLLSQSTGGAKEEAPPEGSGLRLSGWADFQLPDNCRSQREIKQKALVILGLIDAVRKNILQLDLLELRCRELVLSINKAMEAFRHEFRIIRRKIYPFGIFSRFYRTVRGLWGRTYFSSRDLREIAALGSLTGNILTIADSPLIAAGR